MIKKQVRGFLNVDYDDGKQSTYRAFELKIGDKKIRFETGDPIVDYIDYIIYISDHADEIGSVGYSSSWDHFFMDGKKWMGKRFDNDGKLLKSADYIRMSMSEINNYQEYVTNSKINSFKALRDYYRKAKGLPPKED